MTTTLRFLSAGFLALFFVMPVSRLSAQDAQSETPSGTIHIQQTSELDAIGTWSMQQPNHESFNRTDAKLDMPNMLPGAYVLFVNPPNGMSAHIDVSLGDDVIASSDTPQINFTLADKMTLTITVKYKLAIFGKIGVNSVPTGVAFELHGPDGLLKTGVTPAEFFPEPIGNYSVTYKPDGCPQPPPESGLLNKDGRIGFVLSIVCSTFKPIVAQEKPKNVTTQFGGQSVTFTDVPSDAWFAPYITTIASRGIMSGYTDAQGASTGLFGPGDPVTLAQLAKIAHTAMKIDENAAEGAPANPGARGQWFTRYIASAEELGWSVYADGTVDLHRPATRGEVVATLLQLLDIPVRWAKGDKFTDVTRRTSYAGAIETAAKEGIVSGSTDNDGKSTGLFHPGEPISRAEIAKILIAIREKYLMSSSSQGM